MPSNKKYVPKDELSDEIDSPHDRQVMNEQTTNINMPDVHDIPGQEDFNPAPAGEIADTTISSSDEEGNEVFDDTIDKQIMDSPDSNVSETEREELAITAHDMPGDDENLREAALDNTDDDGTPLNEESFKTNITASDLDIPGQNLDDENEFIGEEDEENNDYSQGADNDEIPQDEF